MTTSTRETTLKHCITAQDISCAHHLHTRPDSVERALHAENTITTTVWIRLHRIWQISHLYTCRYRPTATRRFLLLRKILGWLIRPPGTTVPDGLMFYRRCFLFSPCVLRGPSTDRPETLPHGQNLAELYNPTPKIRGLPPKKKQLGAKNIQNFGQFCATSDFDRKYLRSPEWGNISKIGKRYKLGLGQFLLRLTKNVRWNLVH